MSSGAGSSNRGAPKNETHANRGLRLLESGSKSLQKHMRVRIKAVIDTEPSSLQPVVDFLKCQGRLDPSGEPVGEEAKRALGRYKRSAGGDDGPGDTPAGGTSPSKTAINKNFTRPNNIPPSHLWKWLSIAEPAIFSPGNEKLVIVRGQRAQTQEWCCQYIEFIYGFDATVPLFADGRTEEHMSSFEAALPLLNKHRGRRGRDLILPVRDWATCEQGNYKVEKKSPGFMLRHTWSDCQIMIPHQHVNGATSISDFRIELNFSERRAVVRCPRMKGPGLNCYDMFVAAGKMTESCDKDANWRACIPKASKPSDSLLMIQDGSAPEATKKSEKDLSMDMGVPEPVPETVQENCSIEDSQKVKRRCVGKTTTPCQRPTMMSDKVFVPPAPRK